MIAIEDLRHLVDGLSETQWKGLYLNHARGERSDVVPFPDAHIQRVTNGQDGETTAKGAISILDCVMACVGELHSVPEATRQLRVLDYGCGWGRITRLLPFYFDVAGITGVDPEESLIASANELVPFIRHRVIASMQPLPFEDASLDVVFANSVFSHLSERSARFTLSELSRILTAGGVLVISTLERGDMDKFYDSGTQRDWIERILGVRDEAAARLERDGFVWGDTKRWPDYGIAIASERWIADALDSNGIKYLGSKQGAHMGSQHYKYGIKAPRVGVR